MEQATQQDQAENQSLLHKLDLPPDPRPHDRAEAVTDPPTLMPQHDAHAPTTTQQMRKAGNESPTSMPDAGTLATPQVDLEQDAIVAIKYHDGGLSLSDALIKQATGNNNGAFVNKLSRSTKKLADSMRKNLNRQVFGTGSAG